LSKLKIGILYGGTSSERFISIRTAKMIAAALDLKKYYVTPIEISKEGRFIFRNLDELSNDIFSNTNYNLSALEDFRMIFKTNIKLLVNADIDIVFIALHGINGEDGTIQGLLECIKLPYTGSSVTASAIAIDKNFTKQLYVQNGISTPKWLKLSHSCFEDLTLKNNYIQKIKDDLSLPLIIKPCKGGSSIGIEVIYSYENLEIALENCFSYEKNIIVEEYIKGRELTCGIIGTDSSAKSLNVIEIEHNKEYFGYKDKYELDTQNDIKEFVPAQISDNLKNKIQNISLNIHKLLGCQGISASDFIIDENDSVFAIETNTIPGLTKTSLIPKSAKASGIEFEKLLDLLIEDGLKKFK
jgi:D-alanine-D-alanine ligase